MRKPLGNKPHDDPPFHMGERVAIGRKAGVIVAAYPDGFHLVRLDETREVTGAHFSELVSIDDARGDFNTRDSNGANAVNT